NKKKMPTNLKKNETASYDWLRGFMNRNKNSSLRSPESISKASCNCFQPAYHRKILQSSSRSVKLEAIWTEVNCD
ncbi:hypothetical protein ILUMI_14468, partial [Ignelater luminosus]